MTHYYALPRARSLLDFLGWSYIAGLLVWFGRRLVFFDGLWWLALLNTVAFYLLLPLAFLLPMALWRRRWRLLLGSIAPCAMFAALFGPLLLPAFKTPPPTKSVCNTRYFNPWFKPFHTIFRY